MGTIHWGLGIYNVYMCILLVMMVRTCTCGGNLTTASCHDNERLALLKFKHSVQDVAGLLSSWRVGSDCCRWERVGCDGATGRVVSLYLGSKAIGSPVNLGRYYETFETGYVLSDEPEYYYLVGDEVNSCLTELVNLKHLDLGGNYFKESRIPNFMGSFEQLTYLNLSRAGFYGNIPHQLGNLSNLKVLDLSSEVFIQELMTKDMAWISGLSKLEHVDLTEVDLSKAQNLESLLYMSPSLSKLILSGCGLPMAHFGSRHLNISRELASIKHMDLSGNYFTGQVPAFVLNMTSLVFLDISGNNLSMQQSFEDLINLNHLLDLRLSGSLIPKFLSPTSLNFSTYSNIQHLDLSWNEIEGKFSSVLTNMTSLLSLDLSANTLNSYIPAMPNLLKLDISSNHLRRVRDVGIWRQCHLKELIVSYNILEGEMIGSSTNVSKCPQMALEILYLEHNQLNGTIPSSLGRFTNLRDIDLSFNELTGAIPEALGKLRSLQGLYVSYNQLNSCVPESLGALTSLTEIYLKSNRFTSPVLVTLGKLTSLRVLSVSSNMLNETIPHSIGQLNKLHYLDISNNSLQGVVSQDHFANLSMLKYLNTNSNNKLLFNISREWIPPFQLKVAQLGSCKIEDGFPQWLRTQRKVEYLGLSNTSISGPLPKWLRFLPNIHRLDLSNNKLTGPLTNLPSVQSNLLLQDNLFKGLIPRWLCEMIDLDLLDLSRNRLTGKIPICLWDLSLKVMLLSSNRLSGVIPSSLGDNASLFWLQLNDNNLSGELPRDLGYLKRLVVLDLGENKISGNIPEWIGENITRLVAFRLHKNNFTGQIPHSLCKSTLLRILDLAQNNLTGSIPRCFGELGSMKDYPYDPYTMFGIGYNFGYGSIMQVLKGAQLDYKETLRFVINMDLSSNRLVGEIPETLTSLDGLMGLNLSYNQFSGGIPKTIGNMKSLFSLDLSANKLTGMIPPSLAALNFLSHLNLSHNNLTGQIPTGSQLQTLTNPSIYADNPYLCGAPLPKECSPHVKPPTTTSPKKDKNANDPNKVWFYLDIMSGFATGFWGIIGVLYFKKQWRQNIFMIYEGAMDKIYVAVVVRVSKMRRGREAA